jgi:hypothetical protein
VALVSRNGPCVCCGIKTFNRQIFVFDYPQFVEKAPVRSTLFTWVWSLNSGKVTAQVAVHERYHSTCKSHWEASQEMAAVYCLRREIC